MQMYFPPEPEQPLAPFQAMSSKNAVRISLCLVLCFFAIISYVLYFPSHIAAADNGDYWRYAETTGVYGVESFTDDEYPYAYKFYDQWLWLPFTADILSPLRPQLSNAYPISVVRLATNLFSDTGTSPYQIWYLSLVCVPLLLFGAFHLFKFGLMAIGKWGLLFCVAGIFLLGGSEHLGYLHSFYGESMMYVWTVVLLGTACGSIIAKQGSVSGKALSVAAVVSAHMMLTAKGQSIVAFPFWFVILGLLAWYHFISGEKQADESRRTLNRALMLGVVGIMIVSSVSCVKLYSWNSDIVSTYNIYNSLLNGLLPIVDDPEETLTELGLDPILAQDTGKTAFDQDLTIPLTSAEAQEQVFDRIDVIGILMYYVRHPNYLFRAMEETADYAAAYDSSLLLSRTYDEAGEEQFDEAHKFALWESIRPFLVPRSFLYYVVFYLVMFGVSIYLLVRSRKFPQTRLAVLVFMGLMITGILQFPLPLIGNGVADTSKQLYLFMLSYDLTVLTALGFIFYSVYHRYYLHEQSKMMARQQRLDDLARRIQDNGWAK